MRTFFADYTDNLEELHKEILQTIVDLPQKALDWTPFPGGNSCNVIVTHIAGAEKYWLGDVVAGKRTGRDRDAEFKVKNLTIADLEDRLQESSAFVGDVLAELNLEDLKKSLISPRNNQEITVAWALDHALKHTAIHLGHIQITRQLWDEHHGK